MQFKIKNTTKNASNIKSSIQILPNPNPNSMTFLNAKLERTNGLNLKMVINPEEIFSSGKITFEKNISSAAIIMEEKIMVSSLLNRYPINIPMAMKTETVMNKTIIKGNIISNIGIFKIYLTPIITGMN